MDLKLLITIIGLPIYLFLIIYFRRYRQWLLYYLIGAFGLTMLITLPVEYLKWDYYLIGVESFHANLLGRLLGISGEIMENGRIALQTGSGRSILQIGIECSGVLEAGVLIGLVAFYPVFRFRSKLLKIAFGLAVTYLINIVRILLIIVIVAKFGIGYVFIAHAVVARLFFFSLAITLYWYILTKPTLKIVGEATAERRLASAIDDRPGRAHVIGRGVKIASTLIIVALFAGSFALSSDWRNAFGLVADLPDRPFIYSDQTGAELIAENGKVLGAEDSRQESESEQILAEFSFENMLSNEQNTYKYKVLESGEFNIRLVHGTQPVYIEIYKNGLLENTSSLVWPEAGIILDQDVFYMPTSAGPGDTLEIKFKNKGESRADYVAEIISKVTIEEQVSLESTETPIPDEKNGDYCDAESKQAEVVSNLEAETNQTEADTTPAVAAPTKTHAPVAEANDQKLATHTGAQPQGKVLGESTQEEVIDSINRENGKTIRFALVILGATTLVFGALSIILAILLVRILNQNLYLTRERRRENE